MNQNIVWKNFSFFTSESFPNAIKDVGITCCCLSGNYLFTGGADGRVTLLKRNDGFAGSFSFPAYVGQVTHMKYLAAHNMLATLGDDDTFNIGILRLWVLPSPGSAPAESASVAPPPHFHEHILFSSRFPPPTTRVPIATCFNDELAHQMKFRDAQSSGTDGVAADAVTTVIVSFDVASDLLCASVGLCNNECVLLFGDLQNPRTVKVRRLRSEVSKGKLSFVGLPSKGAVRISAPRLSHTAQQSDKMSCAPAGKTRKLGTSGDGDSNAGDAAQVLFTVFEDVVSAWRVEPTGCTEFRSAVPFGGTTAGCSLSEEGSFLTVAHPTTPQIAQTFAPLAGASSPQTWYDPTKRESVRVIDLDNNSRKRVVCSYRSYILVLGQRDANPSSFVLQCYDCGRGIRALNSSQEKYSNCAFLLADRAGPLVVCVDTPSSAVTPTCCYGVTQLAEIDVARKMELLITKEFYDVAKQIAESQRNVDPELRADILKQYGDYLYAKEKYGDAMDEYVETIGVLEPSYVIRKYIQSTHLPLLTRYLEGLHSRSRGAVANVTHTTILLNCYIKQKEEKKLMDFICREDVSFEPHNAISICRRGGYSEAALLMADKYAIAMESARILLYDMEKPAEALDFLYSQRVDVVEEIAQAIGKDLLHAEPEKTTQLLTQLCTAWPGPGRRRMDYTDETPSGLSNRGHARDYIASVFLEHPVFLLRFLESVVQSGVLDGEPPDDNLVVYNTLFELYVTPELKNGGDTTTNVAVTSGAVISAALSDTATAESSSKRADKALTLLNQCRGRYNDYTALCLSFQHHFEEGIVFLLRSMGQTADMFNFFLHKARTAPDNSEERNQIFNQLIDYCIEATPSAPPLSSGDNRSGTIDASLWRMLLTELVRSGSGDGGNPNIGGIERVLEHVYKHNLLSCVEVMEVFCDADDAIPLEVIRSYAQRSMLDIAKETEAVQQQSAAKMAEIRKRQSEIDRLKTSAVVVQTTTCAHCSQPLDIPMVHFMCAHTFHQRCLYSCTECNICAPVHRAALDEVRRAQKANDEPRHFLDALLATGTGDDGAEHQSAFSVITEFMQSGVLSNLPHVPEDLSLFNIVAESGATAAAAAQRGDNEHDGVSSVNSEELEVW